MLRYYSTGNRPLPPPVVGYIISVIYQQVPGVQPGAAETPTLPYPG